LLIADGAAGICFIAKQFPTKFTNRLSLPKFLETGAVYIAVSQGKWSFGLTAASAHIPETGNVQMNPRRDTKMPAGSDELGDGFEWPHFFKTLLESIY
jgi:hypothetical protein